MRRRRACARRGRVRVKRNIVTAQAARVTEPGRASVCPLARAAPSRLQGAERLPLAASRPQSGGGPAVHRRTAPRQGLHPGMGVPLARRDGCLPPLLYAFVDASLVWVLAATPTHLYRCHLRQRQRLRLAMASPWRRLRVPAEAPEHVYGGSTGWTLLGVPGVLQLPLP